MPDARMTSEKLEIYRSGEDLLNLIAGAGRPSRQRHNPARQFGL